MAQKEIKLVLHSLWPIVRLSEVVTVLYRSLVIGLMERLYDHNKQHRRGNVTKTSSASEIMFLCPLWSPNAGNFSDLQAAILKLVASQGFRRHLQLTQNN